MGVRTTVTKLLIPVIADQNAHFVPFDSNYRWTTSYYQVKWRRNVVSKVGNTLTLDAPIVQPIEAVYGGAVVYRYELLYNSNPVEIQNVGVENLRIESVYANDLDENHGKHAIRVQRVSNGWVRQVTARYFWSGVIYLR